MHYNSENIIEYNYVAFTAEAVEQSLQQCLISSRPELPDVQVVTKALGLYYMQNLQKKYPEETKQLLLAAQRIWYVREDLQPLVRDYLFLSKFRPLLPQDIRLVDKQDKVIITNSLILQTSSGYFKGLLSSDIAASSNKLRENWSAAAHGPVIETFDSPVSVKAVKILLGKKIDHADEMLIEALHFLQPTPDSAYVEASTNQMLIAQLCNSTTGENVLDRFVSLGRLDPYGDCPHCAVARQDCLKFIISAINSPKDWEEIASTLDNDVFEQLLNLGMRRHIDYLRNIEKKSKTLFKKLNEPGCTDVLVGRWVGKLTGDRNRWLKQWSKKVSHVTDFSYLNIRGLSTEKLSRLLDQVAPYATQLNLSGFPLEQDDVLWTRNYPNLTSLNLSESPELSIFKGTRSQLPSLTHLDLSNSPRVIQFDNPSLPLTSLDVHGCFHWQDHRFIEKNQDQNHLTWLNVSGCSDDFTSSARLLAETVTVVFDHR
ncbi:MAG: hypothetical protein Q8K75_04960 [Chlamydiales bacterium]|nr:hypothetical protein [Chlamydiales bacterium]